MGRRFAHLYRGGANRDRIPFPNRRGVLEGTAVGLPIIAFLLRFRTGGRHIDANHCSNFVKGLQFGVFLVAIVPLVLFDSFMILSHLMPAGAIFAAGSDHIIGGVLFAIYLALMAIAMYPGRTTPSPSESDDTWYV